VLPLIVTAAEIDEIADLIGATSGTYEEELDRRVSRCLHR